MRLQHTDVPLIKMYVSLTLLPHLIPTEVMAHTTNCIEFHSFVCLSILSHFSQPHTRPRGPLLIQTPCIISVFPVAFQ